MKELRTLSSPIGVGEIGSGFDSSPGFFVTGEVVAIFIPLAAISAGVEVIPESLAADVVDCGAIGSRAGQVRGLPSESGDEGTADIAVTLYVG